LGRTSRADCSCEIKIDYFHLFKHLLNKQYFNRNCKCILRQKTKKVVELITILCYNWVELISKLNRAERIISVIRSESFYRIAVNGSTTHRNSGIGLHFILFVVLLCGMLFDEFIKGVFLCFLGKLFRNSL